MEHPRRPVTEEQCRNSTEYGSGPALPDMQADSAHLPVWRTCFTFLRGQSGIKRPERHCAIDLHAAVGDLPAVCRCRLFVSPRVLRNPARSCRGTEASVLLWAEARPVHFCHRRRNGAPSRRNPHGTKTIVAYPPRLLPAVDAPVAAFHSLPRRYLSHWHVEAFREGWIAPEAWYEDET